MSHHYRHWCKDCRENRMEVDRYQEQIGVEERARNVIVIGLDCEHEIVYAASLPVHSPFGVG